MNIYNNLLESKKYITNLFPYQPDIGIILGSGLGDFVDTLSQKTVIDYSKIPNFKSVKIKGHAGKLVLFDLNGIKIAILQGRYHYYEGHNIQDVIFPVRVLGSLGVKKIIITNAAGGIDKKLTPGNLMIITDHINMMGINPLIGDNNDKIGTRFPDMTNVYTKELVNIIAENMRKLNLEVKEGVYSALSGPSYETPAEIKMLRVLGASAVGMSTVPEAIAARHMGMKIAGISCITNLAAGISDNELNHKEVTKIANNVKDDFIKLITNVLNQLSLKKKGL